MPDLLGALLLAGATAALVLAIVKGTDWGWVSLPTGGTLAGALVLLALFGWRCRVHRSPLVDLALLRHRPFVVANAASIVAAAGFFGYTLVNVLFLTEVWRYSVLEAGLAITPGPVVAIAVSRPFGRLAEKIGHRLVLLGGGLWWGAAVLRFADGEPRWRTRSDRRGTGRACRAAPRRPAASWPAAVSRPPCARRESRPRGPAGSRARRPRARTGSCRRRAATPSCAACEWPFTIRSTGLPPRSTSASAISMAGHFPSEGSRRSRAFTRST